MRIYQVIEGTRVNGPGYRLGIWTQGCERHCPGCFNTEACEPDGGREISVGELLSLLDKQQYDGISVSGGEPFRQEKELEELLRGAVEKGATTLVFTGYTHEEISESPALRHCDFLVDGPYDREAESTCKYAGSGNQRFLRLEDGRIAEDLTPRYRSAAESEITIGMDGNIVATGFADI